MKVTFYLRRGKHIYYRTNSGGKRVDKSTGIEVENPSFWNGKTYNDPRKLKYSQDINEQLEGFSSRLARPLYEHPSTLRMVITHHIDQQLKLGRIKKTTHDTYADRLKMIEAFCFDYFTFSDALLKHVNIDFAVELRCYLNDNYSPNVVSNTLILVKAAINSYMMDFRGKYCLMDTNPFDSKKITEVRNKPTKKMEYLDPSLEIRLHNLVTGVNPILIGSRNQGVTHRRNCNLLALLMWNTGLSFVDLSSGVDIGTDLTSGKKILSYKRQKSGQIARIPIHKDLEKVLDMIKAMDYDQQGWNNWLPIQNFIIDGDLNQSLYRSEYRKFGYYCTFLEAFFDRTVSPHIFRHSFAVKMLEIGYSMEAVKEMMGHSSIETLQGYYAHITDKRLTGETLKIQSA